MNGDVETATEAGMFASLYRSQFQQGAAVVRHASVGEPYTYVTDGHADRAQHGVRRIDALVIKRNVAHGDRLWAVEIKVSASDLRREIQSPEKAEAWAQYTHSFYFLVTPELEALALDIIPKRYGVMVTAGYRGTYTRVSRRAANNRAPLPLPLDTWRRLADKLGGLQYEAATS